MENRPSYTECTLCSEGMEEYKGKGINIIRRKGEGNTNLKFIKAQQSNISSNVTGHMTYWIIQSN